MPNLVAIFGYGYTGAAFAHRLADSGFTVYGTKRNPITQPNHLNITLLPLDETTVISLLEKANYLLISIPPNENDMEPFLRRYANHLLQDHFTWIGYLSSTAVYGDHQGEWVTETSPCFPTNAQAIKRLQAEETWLTHYTLHQLPVHIFRLAGIYGPYRNRLEKIKNGKDFTIHKPHQVFSRIHVDDISSILYQSLQQPMPGEIFNLCDDYPAPLHEVDQFAATLLNHPPLKIIPFEQANLSPMGRSFFESNRRVSNQKIKDTLNVSLNYPTFKEGLRQIGT